jgi:hypothetical protein
MSTVPLSLVNDYIKRARLVAMTPTEKAAVEAADKLAHQEPAVDRKSRRLPKGKRPLQQITPDSIGHQSPADEIEGWKALIFKQLYMALCKHSRKYATEVSVFKRGAELLIGAVAGYVASSLGVGVAVVAALVAAALRFVLKIGLGAFCERFA